MAKAEAKSTRTRMTDVEITKYLAHYAKLHDLKAALWSRFGYDDAFLRSLESRDFWQEQVGRIPDIDREIAELRTG